MRKGCKRNKPRFGAQGPKCRGVAGSNTARMNVSVLVVTWKRHCGRDRMLWYVAVRWTATEMQMSGWTGTLMQLVGGKQCLAENSSSVVLQSGTQ